MKILVQWILKSLVLLITAYLIPGFRIESYTTAFVVALVLGVLNLLVKPVLALLTLPINILTLGLFTFVVNAILLMIASSLVKGFHVDSFFTAIVASVCISIISGLLEKIFS